MKKFVKKKVPKKRLKFLFIIVVVLIAGYALYDCAVENAAMRIKKSVAEGVRKGARNALNPFKWARNK